MKKFFAIAAVCFAAAFFAGCACGTDEDLREDEFEIAYTQDVPVAFRRTLEAALVTYGLSEYALDEGVSAAWLIDFIGGGVPQLLYARVTDEGQFVDFFLYGLEWDAATRLLVVGTSPLADDPTRLDVARDESGKTFLVLSGEHLYVSTDDFYSLATGEAEIVLSRFALYRQNEFFVNFEPVSEAEHANAPGEILGITEILPLSDFPTLPLADFYNPYALPPPPMPEPPPRVVTFESGTLGVKFGFDNLHGWEFEIWDHGSTNTALVRYLTWEPRGDGGSHMSEFSISEWTWHPSEWRQWFGEEPGLMFNQWEMPDEPDEVFVTDNGITMVRYSGVYARNWWDDDNPDPAAAVLFIFRSDGRDYREIEGRQIFYVATLDMPLNRLDDFYDDARTVLNTLRFYDDAAISVELTPAAREIGLTRYNFPRIDSSTSLLPLTREMIADFFELPPGEHWTPYTPWRASRTVPAYELLIAGEVDMIFVPEPSAHVLSIAESAGVGLEFVPIAAEALVFITSVENPVSEITLEQVLAIYTDMSITNWAQIGGDDGRIIPLNRNWHSGSQTLMDNMVLEGRPVHPDLARYEIDGMSDMISEAAQTHRAWAGDSPGDFLLGYTVYFFLQPGTWAVDYIQTLALNGVAPSRETIISGEYPLSTSYFAVIRGDTPADAPARAIVDWILSSSGQDAVERAWLGRLN